MSYFCYLKEAQASGYCLNPSEVDRRFFIDSNPDLLCLAWGRDHLGEWLCPNRSRNSVLPGYCSSHTNTSDRSRPPKGLRPCKCGYRKRQCVCEEQCTVAGCQNERFGDRQKCRDHTHPRLRNRNPYSLRDGDWEWIRSLSDLCGICTLEMNGKGHIDHDHSCCPSGRYCKLCIRGVICPTCNTKLVAGYERLPEELRDSQLLNQYLRKRAFVDAGLVAA